MKSFDLLEINVDFLINLVTGRRGFLLQLGRHQDLLKSYLLFLDLHHGNLLKGIDTKTAKIEKV